MKSEFFQEELDSIVNDDIREFASVLLNNAYDYLYTCSASSTGKYHPQYAQGEGGLARHSKAVTRMLNHTLSLEQHAGNFTEREQDLMRVACLYHDGEKYGRETDSKYTVFEHPLLAAETVRGYKGKYLSEGELDFIAGAIASHSGQWTTTKRSDTVLPKPETAEQRLVHLCDYLSSRRDIEVQFSEYVKPEIPPLDDYVLTFGKYKGHRLLDVADSDRGYVDWLKENYGKEPVRTLLRAL